MKTLAETYQTLNPNVKIEIRETDSQNGLSGAMEGTYDLGMSSRELKSYEEELLTKVKIAQDNIEVIVNKDNPVREISMDQLRKIYTGELTEWSQLNGAKEEK